MYYTQIPIMHLAIQRYKFTQTEKISVPNIYINGLHPTVIKFVRDLRQLGGFSPRTPICSTSKTDRHDIAVILLKVALNTIILYNMNVFMLIHVVWYVYVYVDSCRITWTYLCWVLLYNIDVVVLIRVIWHVHVYVDSCCLICTCLCWFVLYNMNVFMLIHVV
jgi:hypothetical protein